jgi:hypothetical protein
VSTFFLIFESIRNGENIADWFSLASNIGKIEPLNVTPYVEECCADLEKEQEYSTDLSVAFQTRLHCMVDASRRTFPGSGVDYFGVLGVVPVTMLTKSFEKELDRFRTSLPPDFQQDSKLPSNLSLAELFRNPLPVT